MQVLTRLNKVIAYSAHGYTPVGNTAVCAVTNECYTDALIVNVDYVPTDIDQYDYYYIDGKFIKGDVKFEQKIEPVVESVVVKRKEIAQTYEDTDGSQLFAALDVELASMGGSDSRNVSLSTDGFLGRDTWVGTLHKIGSNGGVLNIVSQSTGDRVVLNGDSGVWSVSHGVDTDDITRIYKSLGELGITAGNETIEAIVNAMVNKSMLVYSVSTSSAEVYPQNPTYGVVFVIKNDASCTVFQLFDKFTNKSWTGRYSNSSWLGWKRIATTDDIGADISELEKTIATNSKNISTNTGNISANAKSIASNTSKITALQNAAEVYQGNAVHTAFVEFGTPIAGVPMTMSMGSKASKVMSITAIECYSDGTAVTLDSGRNVSVYVEGIGGSSPCTVTLYPKSGYEPIADDNGVTKAVMMIKYIK